MTSRGIRYLLAGAGCVVLFALGAVACDMAAAFLGPEDGGFETDGAVVGGDGGSAGGGDSGGTADAGGHADAGGSNDSGGGCDCPNGCCAQNGVCNLGNTDAVCGKGGAACADCAADGKKCVNQACEAPIGCTRSSDCPLGDICYQQKCVDGCGKDADCPTDAPKCKTSVTPHGKCVACLADADCKNAGNNYVCNADGACEKGKPVCNPKCLAWEECGQDSLCHAKPGYCSSDNDCAAPQTCDVSSHTCLKPECTADGDCSDTSICASGCGGTCAAGKCQCISICGAQLCGTCSSDADCQPGLSCSGLLTKYCNTSCSADSDCNGKHCYTWIKSCQCP